MARLELKLELLFLEKVVEDVGGDTDDGDPRTHDGQIGLQPHDGQMGLQLLKGHGLDVVYNASNNGLVRMQTLVKSTIVDASPFEQWYL